MTASQTTLRDLLDANLREHGPEYADGLSNHLPMALHALQVMGASETRMREFYASYARRFEGQAAPVAGQEAVADWRLLRGQPDAYPALHASFAEALAREGAVEVLRRSLPELLSGVAAAAFHGAIRTAHAVQAGHRGELAAALASLPEGRTPTQADWQRLSRSWQPLLDERIAALSRLRDQLSSCIGCGCLSLTKCKLYNPADRSAERGAGARYLLGDKPL